MDWYYAKDGQQVGPVSEEELAQLKENGQLTGEELVWNESLTDWVPMRTLRPFADTVPETPPAAPPERGSTSLSPAPAPARTLPPGEQIPTYLWQSIVCLVLCCLPTAIVALVFATKVDPAIAKGDIAAAKEASSNAKMWCWISFGIGLVVNTLYLGIVFLSIAMEV